MDKIAELEAEVARLQSHDKEAMELVELAYDNAWRNLNCGNCANYGCAKQVVKMRKCLGGDGDWIWIYADRYEALKAQSIEMRD